MKKLAVLALSFTLVLTISGTVFAATNVSEMAVNKGGQHVAECAKTMSKGISECVKMGVCNH